MFAADIADWRPNGGSTCEQAVLIAACRSGDAFVELAARDGGHFGAGGLARKLGIDAFAFPMLDDLIDVERTVGLIERHPRIRLALIQPSHSRRPQPIEALAAALPQRVTIAVDVSHTAGLIAGGLLPQPLMHGAHILTFNTHKTLPGPNKGVIAFADRNHPLAETVWDVVCPQLQSNSHPECLPGLVIALEEVATFGRAYAQQVVRNARALARVLDSHGLRVAGMEYGGTETHQVHVRIGAADVSNNLASELLPTCAFRTNSVIIPGTDGEFGLRLGTQALTRRGLTEVEFAELGHLLARAVRWRDRRCSTHSPRGSRSAREPSALSVAVQLRPAGRESARHAAAQRGAAVDPVRAYGADRQLASDVPQAPVVEPTSIPSNCPSASAAVAICALRAAASMCRVTPRRSTRTAERSSTAP